MRVAPGRPLAPILLWVTACGTTPVELAPVPDAIELTPITIRLVVGASEQLVAVVRDTAGDEIASADVTFSSNDTTVARVSPAGLVSGAAVGAAVITARNAPASATAVVTVQDPAALLAGPDTVLALYASLQLAPVVLDDVGDPIPDPPVTYVSRDPALVSVTSTGVATALEVGTAWVVMSIGTLRDSLRVTSLVARVRIAGRLIGAAVSAAGTAFVTNGSNATVARFALPATSVSGTIAAGTLPSSVAFNGAGDRAYVGNQDAGTVSIVDVATNGVVATAAFGSAVLATAVAPGDTLLLVATDVRLYWLRLADLAITDTLDVSPYSNALLIRDTLLYASIPGGGVVLEIDIPSAQIVRTFAVGGVPQGLVLPPGNELYIANEAGYVQIWDLLTNTQVDTVRLPGGGGFGLARNPDNGLLFVSTGYYSSDVHVINPATRSLMRVVHTGGTPRRIGFMPGGNLGIVANEGGWVDFIR